MVKLQFTNAVVEDSGYGLEVNGKSLNEIISTALGTRVGNRAGYGSGLPKFESNSCDVTVIIFPNPVTEEIVDDKWRWNSIKEMEEDLENEYNEKIKKTDAEK